MIFGDAKILEMRAAGKILIEPFNEKHVQGTSYDLRLDGFFIDCHAVAGGEAEILTDAENVAALYARMPKIKADKLVIAPGARVLASTIERIGTLVNDITTVIHSRSSWARHGMEVCSCAGYGDPGYASHWTLEIYNKNSFPVLLERGMRIAQITFYPVEGCTKPYVSKYSGNGQQREFTDEERFDMMTPRAIKSADADYA